MPSELSENSKAAEPDIFTCKMCGDCCRGYGGTYVTPEEIEALSTFVGTDSQTFVAQYCRMSGQRPLIRQGDNGYCIFWDKMCTVHPVKPTMCRKWPYLESVLIDIDNWKIMANSCPGIQIDASDEKIIAEVKKQLAQLKA